MDLDHDAVAGEETWSTLGKDYYVEQYRSMLEENLKDYADNFNSYMLQGSEPKSEYEN